MKVTYDRRRWVIHLYTSGSLSLGQNLPLSSSLHSNNLSRSGCRGWSILDRRHSSGSTMYTISHGSITTIIIVVSISILLILKDPGTNLLVTYTLKSRRATWLCLVEGNLASLHDSISVKVEHTICSRMNRITKENPIRISRLKLIQLALLQNETLATKCSKVTHLGLSSMHQLIRGLLLESTKENAI